MLRQMTEAATNWPKFTLATPAEMVTTLNGMGVKPLDGRSWPRSFMSYQASRSWMTGVWAKL